VLEQFRTATAGLTESADILQRESNGIRAEISDMLVSLQFQDRTSQILGHVRDDLDGLHRFLNDGKHNPGHAKTVDARAWLERMAKTYTTAEQRTIHAGGPATQDKPEITFF
jgi:methyl-accepting chemotaxis protein